MTGLPRRGTALSVYALVPAAGRGERFGGAKLLASWRGRALLGHVLLRLGGARAGGLLGTVVVVHRESDEAIRTLTREYRAHAVSVPSQAELSDSLRAGIGAVASRSDGAEPTALLICLGDQPLIRLEVIEALVDAWRGAGFQAVRPQYRDAPGEPGHPLLLDRSLWGFAADLRGEEGLAPVLARRGIPVKQIPVPGGNPDVDTPDDLAALDTAAGPAGRAG